MQTFRTRLLPYGLACLALFHAASAQALTWNNDTPPGAPANTNVRGFWGTAADNIYAALGNNGTAGKVYRWQGSAWNVVGGTTFDASPARSIIGFGTQEIWVGGLGGQMRRSQDAGNTWTMVNAGIDPSTRMTSIWGASNTDIWAGGLNIITLNTDLFRYNGSTWTAVSHPFGASEIRGIWGTSANSVFFVGVGGAAAFWNGSSLTPMSTGTTEALAAVWGLSASEVYAVGTNAKIVKWNGSAWSNFSSTGITSTLQLNGITGTSSNNLYVCTGSGTENIYHWDGSTWTLETTAGNSLNAIWSSPDGTRFVAGGAASRLYGATGAAPTAPEIVLTETVAGNIADGGSFSFGSVNQGSPSAKTFTITNSGTADLNLTGSPKVNITGTNAADFVVTSAQPASPVTSGGGTATFTVSFTPGAAGARTATLTILNNDSDEGTFDITLNGTGGTESVVGQPTALPLTGTSATGYIFASTKFTLAQAGQLLRLASIAQATNTSTITMALCAADGPGGGPGTILASTGDFIPVGTHEQVPTTTPNVPAGDYWLAWKNTGSAYKGYYTTATSDSTFWNLEAYGNPWPASYPSGASSALQRWSFYAVFGPAVSGPEIELSETGVGNINDAGTFNFGNVNQGLPLAKTFTITNSGTAVLNLTGSPKVDITGANAADFVVTSAQPAATVAANGGTATFTVTFTPGGAGARTATLTIVNDDSDEGTFDITLNGTGVAIPEIAVSGNGTNIPDGNTTIATADDTDFGSVPVQGVSVTHTFTIANSGTANLTLGSVGLTGTGASHFAVSQPLSSTVTPSGSTTFTVTYDPSAAATHTATVSFTNNDSNESPFNFDVQGTGTGPRTFDLAGNPVSNTPFDTGDTYIYSAGPPPPAPVGGPAGTDVVTGGNATDGTGAADGTQFDQLQRSGYLAENGTLAFLGYLQMGVGGVDLTNYMGYWKSNGSSLSRIARQGFDAPETGATAAKFNILPLIPGINDDGQVTLTASLLQSGASTPATTADNDLGIWSELGGTGFQILIREDDTIPGLGGPKVDSLGYGCFATTRTSATTGEAAFPVGMKGGSTDTALLRTSVVSSDTTAVGVIARENQAAPGCGGENFNTMLPGYSGSVRMDATGNVVFAGWLKPSGKLGIWYQDQATKTVSKTVLTGETAPGTTATFQSIDLPNMGGGGTYAFRAVLNLDGDNAANDKNDGIWKGTGTAAPSLILRRGDSNTNRPGLFTGAILTANPSIKAGNVYNGWLTNANHGAWLGWVDLAGDGISSFPADTFGVYTDASGTMTLLTASGQPAPGMPAGANFFFIDHPVCGGTEQVAFIATVTGGGTTAGTNDKGVWRSASNGGVLSLVLRTGDTMSVNVNGTPTTKTIADVDIPGSGYAEHIWETPVMDATGRLLIFVTFTDGSTTQVIVPSSVAPPP